MEKINWKFYLNPAKNKLHIEYLSDYSETAEINIQTIHGQQLKTFSVESGISSSLDISDLCSGLYIIEIVGQHYKSNRLFVVE